MSSVVFRSFLWSMLDRFGSIFISFLLNLILARFFLSARDYGIIGMINIFIAIANATVISGFGQALIQRKSLSKEDYNTTFTFNLVTATFLYIVLFLCAPIIAWFYSEPTLVSIIRVLSLNLIINGFFIVQNSHLIREMKFKRLSLINISTQIISAILSIVLAYKGFGVWVLVTNTLVTSILQTIFLWFFSDIQIRIQFRVNSFKKLFSFGGFMYISTLIETLYSNALYIILGKGFSPQILGYYTQAEKLQGVPSNTIGTIVNQVMFPHYSKLQSSAKNIAHAYISNIRFLSLLTFLFMGLLFAIAPSLIILLFSEKWEPSIYIFQILCIAGIFTPLNTATTSVVKSMGKGRLFFNLQLWKRAIAIMLLLISSTISISVLLYTVCATNILFYIINITAVKQLIPISITKKILLPFKQGISSIVSTIITAVVLHLTGANNLEHLILGSATYLALCFFLLEATKNKEYIYIKKMINKKLLKPKQC